MPSNPEPILEVLDGLIPADLHHAAWARCTRPNWYFGNSSNNTDFGRFWKMDLDGDPAFDGIWNAARARCESILGAPLRVIRQYANGHTYGLGGSPHKDDVRPGTYTLLYYPHLEWQDAWDGETVYFDGDNEIYFAVRPRPNRAVFFDSTILHAGRAPSRLCPGLRVTVAFKLETAATKAAISVPTSATALPPAKPENRAANPAEPQTPAPEELPCEEFARGEMASDGLARKVRLRVPAAQIDEVFEAELRRLAGSVRLPGYAAGEIPRAALLERYGARVRAEVLNKLGTEATRAAFAGGPFVLAELVLESGTQPGEDARFVVKATRLADLPELNPAELSFERLTSPDAAKQALLDTDLRARVLDQLHARYPIPVLPKLVESELAKVRAAVQQSGEEQVPEQELRAIAERRVALGAVVIELARRFGLQSGNAVELEQRVIARILESARVTERPAREEEL